MAVRRAEDDDEGERDRGGDCLRHDEVQSRDRGFQSPHNPPTGRKVHEIENFKDPETTQEFRFQCTAPLNDFRFREAFWIVQKLEVDENC